MFGDGFQGPGSAVYGITVRIRRQRGDVFSLPIWDPFRWRKDPPFRVYVDIVVPWIGIAEDIKGLGCRYVPSRE